jgi:hypothetical protein
MENKIDAELIKVIESSISNSKTCMEALDKVLDWETKNRGLKGFHVSAPLDVMCGQRTIDDPKEEAEKMAHDILSMKLSCAKGHFKDVTNEVL